KDGPKTFDGRIRKRLQSISSCGHQHCSRATELRSIGIRNEPVCEGGKPDHGRYYGDRGRCGCAQRLGDGDRKRATVWAVATASVAWTRWTRCGTVVVYPGDKLQAGGRFTCKD